MGAAFRSVAAVMSLTKLGRSGWRYFAEKIATGREDYFARSAEHGALAWQCSPSGCTCLPPHSGRPRTARPTRERPGFETRCQLC